MDESTTSASTETLQSQGQADSSGVKLPGTDLPGTDGCGGDASGWELETLAIQSGPGGRLFVSDGRGRSLEGVTFVRLFPFTDGDGPVSMLDERGHEVALIPSLAGMSAVAGEAVRTHLARREFMTTIRQVAGSTSSSVPTDWTLETDRGPITIRIRDEDAFRTLPHGELLITDEVGARYLIPCVDKLDAHSRGIVRRFA